jgi:hypothetical protein
MAGRAGADPAAVVVEVDVEIFRDFEDGLVGKIAGHRFTRNRFIFKKKMNSSHCAFDTLPAQFFLKKWPRGDWKHPHKQSIGERVLRYLVQIEKCAGFLQRNADCFVKFKK